MTPAQPDNGDVKNSELWRLVETAALVRRLYPRGGFHGLEANVLQVLIAVMLQPNATVGELVEFLALGQGTVSAALTRLEERGLVRNSADALDGRRRRQHITPDGEMFCRRFAQITSVHIALARR